MHVADIHQQVREEDSIHDHVHVIRVRPDQDNTVFRAVCDGMEGVRDVGLDLTGSILRGVDLFRHRVLPYCAYLALDDLKCL